MADRTLRIPVLNSRKDDFYEISFPHTAHGLTLSCSCPAGVNFRPCKHVAAFLENNRRARPLKLTEHAAELWDEGQKRLADPQVAASVQEYRERIAALEGEIRRLQEELKRFRSDVVRSVLPGNT